MRRYYNHALLWGVLGAMLLHSRAEATTDFQDGLRHATLKSTQTSIIANNDANRTSSDNAEPRDAKQLLNRYALVFIENRGQITDAKGRRADEIAYMAKVGDAHLYFTPRGVSYVFVSSQSNAPEGTSKGDRASLAASIDVSTYRMDMELIGANPNTVIRAEGETGFYSNYYYPHCPQGITNVPSFSKLVYKNVYENIDLVFYNNGQRLKYDFIVHPGGRVSDIRFRYLSASSTELSPGGELHVTNPQGRLAEETPLTYQHSSAVLAAGLPAQVEIESSYRITNGVVSFNVSDYDASQPLVIDPGVKWSTYLGGTANDQGFGIRADASGNIYVSGTTASTDFPVTAGAFQTANGGGQDVFIGKFNSTGARQWMTYFGGNGTEVGLDIDIDPSTNVLVTGYTGSTNFPVASAHQATLGIADDAFVIKLNTNGARLWATYYGGAGGDQGFGIAADASSNVYITGVTNSNNNIATAGASQTARAGGRDAFLVKFNSAGVRQWGTYFGGAGSDESNDMDIDASANVFMVGKTNSAALPTTTGAFQTTLAGGNDAFITQHNTNGVRLWSTYLGGTDEDAANGVDVDPTGSIGITGYTQSEDFPVTGSAFQTTIGGGRDVFAAKFTNGGARVWASYYGGPSTDEGTDIAADLNGNFFVCGTNVGNNLPVPPGAIQNTYAGSNDAIIIQFFGNGSVFGSTYWGGTAADMAWGIDTHMDDICFIGQTFSTDFPTTTGAFQTSKAGGDDAFIVCFESNDVLLPVELTGFDASARGDIVDLNWRTVSESSNAGFEIYRADDSTNNFELIASYLTDAQLVGLGDSPIGKGYGFTDRDGLGEGTYRYKLVDVALDGARTEHGLRTVKIAAAAEEPLDPTGFIVSQVAPNPATDQIQVLFRLPEEQSVSLEIFAMDGGRVAVPVENVSYAAGEHNETISLSGLAPGAYVLKLSTGLRSTTRSFVVVR